MNLYQYLGVNQNKLNGPRRSDSRLSYSTEYGIAFYDCNQMYIDCINHRCIAFNIFDNCMVYDMYRKRWCRYIKECVLIDIGKECV